MMDMVHADIGGKPAQDNWQVIMRTAVQPGFVKIPAFITSPERILELVLDIEQPDADRGGEKRDPKLHTQEWTNADQPDHGCDQNCDCCVCRHRADPGSP